MIGSWNGSLIISLDTKKGINTDFFLDVLWLSFCVYSDPDWSSGLTAEKIIILRNLKQYGYYP
jgi:hypothetical protein